MNFLYTVNTQQFMFCEQGQVMLLCCVLHLLPLNHGPQDTTGVKNNFYMGWG